MSRFTRDPLTLCAEIAEDAGEENVSVGIDICGSTLTSQCFLFGHLADQVDQVRWDNSYKPTSLAERSPEVRSAFSVAQLSVTDTPARGVVQGDRVWHVW